MADAERSNAMKGNQNAKKDGKKGVEAKKPYRYSVGGFFATTAKQIKLDLDAKYISKLKADRKMELADASYTNSQSRFMSATKGVVDAEKQQKLTADLAKKSQSELMDLAAATRSHKVREYERRSVSALNSAETNHRRNVADAVDAKKAMKAAEARYEADMLGYRTAQDQVIKEKVKISNEHQAVVQAAKDYKKVSSPHSYGKALVNQTVRDVRNSAPAAKVSSGVDYAKQHAKQQAETLKKYLKR